MSPLRPLVSVFFFNDTATTEIYTLSLHDALPISAARGCARPGRRRGDRARGAGPLRRARVEADRRGGQAGAAQRRSADRKSTRLNSSHGYISYAVFCLKKKKKERRPQARVHRVSH